MPCGWRKAAQPFDQTGVSPLSLCRWLFGRLPVHAGGILSLSCAQERAFLQAIFAAFLKTLYPDMSGFDCRYIEEKEKER